MNPQSPLPEDPMESVITKQEFLDIIAKPKNETTQEELHQVYVYVSQLTEGDVEELKNLIPGEAIDSFMEVIELLMEAKKMIHRVKGLGMGRTFEEKKAEELLDLLRKVKTFEEKILGPDCDPNTVSESVAGSFKVAWAIGVEVLTDIGLRELLDEVPDPISGPAEKGIRAAGDDFIRALSEFIEGRIDEVHDIVSFFIPEEWNQMSPEARSAIEDAVERAVPGIAKGKHVWMVIVSLVALGLLAWGGYELASGKKLEKLKEWARDQQVKILGDDAPKGLPSSTEGTGGDNDDPDGVVVPYGGNDSDGGRFRN